MTSYRTWLDERRVPKGPWVTREDGRLGSVEPTACSSPSAMEPEDGLHQRLRPTGATPAAAILADPRPYCSGMASIMLAGEEDAGRRGVWPHHKRMPKWFNPADWAAWPVISYSKTELHIVAVASARKGALRRLIDAAAAHGLSPVVVEPMGRAMPAIMQKWGWQMTVVGEGWDRREEWRPASVGRNAERQDAEERLGPQDEHAVTAKPADAQPLDISDQSQ